MSDKDAPRAKKARTPTKPLKAHIVARTKPFKRTTQPHVPTGQRDVFIGYDVIMAIQYDFYVPIAVWHHPAVIDFKNSIGTLSPGGTVFKGATGIWREEKEGGTLGNPVEEDVYIWRIVVSGDPMQAEIYRRGIESYVAEMMARLSECDLSCQKEFMFTETLIIHDKTVFSFDPPTK
jgi:hypothetical protein